MGLVPAFDFSIYIRALQEVPYVRESSLLPLTVIVEQVLKRFLKLKYICLFTYQSKQNDSVFL